MALMRRVTPGTRIFEIDVELHEVRPVVRRRIQVPAEATLSMLHKVLQSAMGWTNTGTHEFEIDGARYGIRDQDSDDRFGNEARVKLRRVAWPGDRLYYFYDVDDTWTHALTVVRIVVPEPGVRYPRCVAGLGACPLEDVGGRAADADVQEPRGDLADPGRDHSIDGEGGALDPHPVDLAEVNRKLGRLAWWPLPVELASSCFPCP
jgi:hypothetical protein